VSCQKVLPDAIPSSDHVQASFHLHLDPVPRLVAEARRFVLSHAPDLDDDSTDALVLLTSELVTNAVLHARTPIELGITIADESVLVTVHDQDLARPEQNPYAQREGGWGLGLVKALAVESAMEPHPDGGKTAWFRISRVTTPDVAHGAAARPTSRDQELRP
jgi:anti-sigma regulatory factor (Ser/Thr protein kinase)